MKPRGAGAARARPAETPDLVDALVQLSFLVQATLGATAAQEDLSIIQLRLLGILRDREPGMMELASYLGLDKSSVTGLIDRAERRGLVKRIANAEDRRAVHVSLTDRGRALTETLAKQIAREVSALTAPLGESSRARLASLASQVVADDARRRRGE